MRRKERESSVAELAARGALAGLVGGVAMAAAERILIPKLPDRRAPRVAPWDARVGRLAKSAGWRLSKRQRTAVAIATELGYAALLGAAYNVARGRLRPSRTTGQLLDAGLALGVSLLAPELPRKRIPRATKGLRNTLLVRPLSTRLTPPSVYGHATSLALRALSP